MIKHAPVLVVGAFLLTLGCQRRTPEARGLSSSTQQPAMNGMNHKAADSAPSKHERTEAALPVSPVQGATKATAQIQPLVGGGVSGNLTFTAENGGVQVSGELHGLKPNTEHGFHVHEKGDCSAPDGSSTGGHFNPHHTSHGAPASPQSHLGDLGNVQSNAQGVAHVSVFKAGADLGSDATSYVGKAVIVHANPDDLKSQPTGAAGGRIACGVVKAE
jgi:Cu-Zn family superoxide dismutase